MSPKVWLSVYGVVAAIVLAGGGFYALSSRSAYVEAMEGWDTKVGAIQSLERRVPYPKKENAEALAERVESYRGSVDVLAETLKSFQRELDTGIPNTQFQQNVKNRVEEFRKTASEGGLEIESGADFQLGFDSYANTVPAPELVPVLDYELEAIDRLLRKLVACGAETLSSFQRDPIPGEAGAPAGHENGAVHKYPVRLQFTGSHDALQQFVNELANDREFFYIVRVLKVNSSLQEGPPKLLEEQGGFEKWENPVTKELASSDLIAEWRADGVSESEVAEKAKAAGFIKADQDARVLMGQEKLTTFLVVDITRFLNKEELDALQPQNQQSDPRKGRK